MGFDSKYGRVTTEYGDIPDDEPVIVFRARDARTVGMLAYYLDLCHQGGSPVRHIRLVAETMVKFLKWQADNPDKVRVPDSERSRGWLGS